MQQNIFDCLYESYKITKPIRLIEFFAGYGSQALALKYLGVEFEHWKICEWAIKSIQAYKNIHFEYDSTDYSKDKTKDELVEILTYLGISLDYDEPADKLQVKRLNEKNLRRIYNNIQTTHNLVNIQQVKGQDLEIVDTDKYTYLLTYSFPCQDLSLAGKGKGMSDTSTRSGMLWEVERILTECKELGNMPEILLMENVPQVHGKNNVEDFNKWQLRLEELGYKNYFQDLIATDYGIPQTRNRCFMVSILGDYSYTFPQPIPLKLKLKDMLEDNVDEKYYLSDKQIMDVASWKAYEKPLEHINDDPIGTLTTRSGAYAAGMKLVSDSLKIKNATKKGYLEAKPGDGIDISSRMGHHRGTVQKDKSQTITTMGGKNIGVLVESNLKKELCNSLIQNNQVKENDVIHHNYTNSKNENGQNNLNNLSPTLDTRCDCLGVCVKGIATNESKEWQKPPLEEKSRTILANKSNCGVGVIDEKLRIRKLTPRECFRLMGVKDEDFDKVSKNQSDSSLYHLAGDSIVVNVLMAIFKEML